jgi:hypothetical protein
LGDIIRKIARLDIFELQFPPWRVFLCLPYVIKKFEDEKSLFTLVPVYDDWRKTRSEVNLFKTTLNFISWGQFYEREIQRPSGKKFTTTRVA